MVEHLLVKMKKLIIAFFLVVIASFSLGLILSRYVLEEERVGAGVANFSVETRAVCEELREPDCYYRCHDVVFLMISGKEIRVYESNEYVCHEEGWIGPRLKRKNL